MLLSIVLCTETISSNKKIMSLHLFYSCEQCPKILEQKQKKTTKSALQKNPTYKPKISVLQKNILSNDQQIICLDQFIILAEDQFSLEVSTRFIVLLFGFWGQSRIIELFSAKSAEYFYHKKTSSMRLSIAQKSLSFRCLLLALVLVCLKSYTLEGPWQLQPEYLNYTKQNPDVSFTFQGFLPTIGRVPAEDTLGGASFSTAYVGNKQVIIQACKRLLYNYYVNESSIYLQYARTLESLRQCRQNELQEIMGKVNATFYFDIAADKLILYYPSSETALTLKRVDKGSLNPLPNTYEQWRITKLRGQTASEPQKSIYFGSDSIYACDLQSLFRYSITQRNNIRTAQVAGNCSNQTSTDIARLAYFYQMDGRRMNVYDSGLNELGELEFVRSIDEKELQRLRAAAEAAKSKVDEGVVISNGGKNIYGGGIVPINSNINGVPQVNNQMNPSNNIVIPSTNIATPNTNTNTVPPSINTTPPNTNTITPNTNTNTATPIANANAVPPTTISVNPSTNTNPPNTNTGIPSTNTVPPSTNTVPPSTNTVPPSTNTVPPVTNPVTPSTNTNIAPTSINALPPTTTNTVPASVDNITSSTNTTAPLANNTSPTSPSTSNTVSPAANTAVPPTNIVPPSTVIIPSTTNTPSTNTVPPTINIPSTNTTPAVNTSTTPANSSSSPSLKPKYSTTLKPPSSTAKTDCHCTSISTADELTPFPPSLFENKWYLYSINGTTHNIQAFYYYFLIITPQRMIYYGGCQVKWSNYQLDKNTLSNLKTFNSNKTSCLTPNLDESVLQPFYDSVKYINHAIISGVPYITFYDKDYEHVATFNTISPNYPSTWS